MAAATSQIYSIGEYPSDFLSLPVAANATIYGGTFVCTDGSGNANPAADTSGFIFAGVADQIQSGSVICGAVAGAVNVNVQGPVHFKNGLLLCPIVSPAQSSVGSRVFIKDSQTVQTSAGSNHVIVGTIVAVITTGTSGVVLVDTRNRALLATS